MARDARAGNVTAASYESIESAALSLEFDAALVAIGAVSFAMEALDAELESAGHVVDESNVVVPKNENAGFWIAHRIAQAFDLPQSATNRLVADLVHLFKLRNNSVHFESEWRDGAKRHPRGTQTAAELTVYTLEKADKMVRVGRSVLTEGAAAVADGRLFPGAADLARELPGVVKMLDEIMTEEGF